MEKKIERTLSQYITENPNNLTPIQFERIMDDLMSLCSSGTIHDETYDYYQWLDEKPGRQEQFYKYVRSKYKHLYGKHALEVGCGRNAILSQMLSKHFKMTAIDPVLEVRDNPEIEYLKAYFTQNTPIWDYDLIIGLEPCDATEHIIRSCLKRKKEFVVVLCGVPHKRLDGKKPKSIEDWRDYLVSIDKEHLLLERTDELDFRPYIIRNRNYD